MTNNHENRTSPDCNQSCAYCPNSIKCLSSTSNGKFKRTAGYLLTVCAAFLAITIFVIPYFSDIEEESLTFQAVVTDIHPGEFLRGVRMDRIHHEAIRSDGVRFEGSFTINAHRHDIVVGDFLQFEEGGIPFGPPRGLERSTSGAYAAAFKNAIIVNPESFPDLDEFIADIDREAGVIFWRATALEGGVTKSPWGEDTNNSGTPDYTFNPNPGTPPWHTEHPAYIHGTGQTVMPLSMPAPPLSESDVVCLAPAGRSPGSDN